MCFLALPLHLALIPHFPYSFGSLSQSSLDSHLQPPDETDLYCLSPWGTGFFPVSDLGPSLALSLASHCAFGLLPPGVWSAWDQLWGLLSISEVQSVVPPAEACKKQAILQPGHKELSESEFHSVHIHLLLSDKLTQILKFKTTHFFLSQSCGGESSLVWPFFSLGPTRLQTGCQGLLCLLCFVCRLDVVPFRNMGSFSRLMWLLSEFSCITEVFHLTSCSLGTTLSS